MGNAKSVDCTITDNPNRTIFITFKSWHFISSRLGGHVVYTYTIRYQRYVWDIHFQYKDFVRLSRAVFPAFKNSIETFHYPNEFHPFFWTHHKTLPETRSKMMLKYIQDLLDIPSVLSNAKMRTFLNISASSFNPNMGRKGKEGYLEKRSGGYSERFSRRIGDYMYVWTRRWVVLHDTCISWYKSPDYLEPRGLLQIDNMFHAEVAGKVITVSTATRKLLMAASTGHIAQQWAMVMNEFYGGTTRVLNHVFEAAFSPRMNCDVKAYTCTKDYYNSLAVSLLSAQSEILITSWKISPTVLLTRPPYPTLRLDQLLKYKADQGVKIFLLLYKEVEYVGQGNDSLRSKTYLESLSPNIRCIRHPNKFIGGSTAMMWSHHEKTVVIDRIVCFVGGVDLAYGRWEDEQRRVCDAEGVLYPGSDYRNPAPDLFKPVLSPSSKDPNSLLPEDEDDIIEVEIAVPADDWPNCHAIDIDYEMPSEVEVVVDFGMAAPVDFSLPSHDHTGDRKSVEMDTTRTNHSSALSKAPVLVPDDEVKETSDDDHAVTHCDLVDVCSRCSGVADDETAESLVESVPLAGEQKEELLVEIGPSTEESKEVSLGPATEEQKTAGAEDRLTSLPVVVHPRDILQPSSRKAATTQSHHKLGYTPSVVPSCSTLGIMQTQVIQGAQELYKHKIPRESRIMPWYNLQATFATFGNRNKPHLYRQIAPAPQHPPVNAALGCSLGNASTLTAGSCNHTATVTSDECVVASTPLLLVDGPAVSSQSLYPTEPTDDRRDEEEISNPEEEVTNRDSPPRVEGVVDAVKETTDQQLPPLTADCPTERSTAHKTIPPAYNGDKKSTNFFHACLLLSTNNNDKERHTRHVTQKSANSLEPRELYPRMPWHDVQASVTGLVARDIASHFVQRWNHHRISTSLYSEPILHDITDNTEFGVCARCLRSAIKEDQTHCPDCSYYLGPGSSYTKPVDPARCPAYASEYSFIVFECTYPGKLPLPFRMLGDCPVVVTAILQNTIATSSGGGAAQDGNLVDMNGPHAEWLHAFGLVPAIGDVIVAVDSTTVTHLNSNQCKRLVKKKRAALLNMHEMPTLRVTFRRHFLDKLYRLGDKFSDRGSRVTGKEGEKSPIPLYSPAVSGALLTPTDGELKQGEEHKDADMMRGLNKTDILAGDRHNEVLLGKGPVRESVDIAPIVDGDCCLAPTDLNIQINTNKVRQFHPACAAAAQVEVKLAMSTLFHTFYRGIETPNRLWGDSGTCKVQLLRSIGKWSTGTKEETSIQNCYIDSINNAKHFIYIENQFFVSSTAGPDVSNGIATALVNRILQAHTTREEFRVLVLIPLHPNGDFAAAKKSQVVMHFEYATINRGTASMYEQLRRRAPGIQISKYLSFHSLRNWGMINNKVVSDQVYVHDKVMIVDDRIVIIGSANINDRSMLGERDSELAIRIEDTLHCNTTMNGQPFTVGFMPHTLRERLMRRHMGEGEDFDLSDPLCEAVQGAWKLRSNSNSAVYDQIDGPISAYQVTTLGQYRDAFASYVNPSYLDPTIQHTMAEIQGFLVDWPQTLLEMEDLLPTLALRTVIPNARWV